MSLLRRNPRQRYREPETFTSPPKDPESPSKAPKAAEPAVQFTRWDIASMIGVLSYLGFDILDQMQPQDLMRAIAIIAKAQMVSSKNQRPFEIVQWP